MLKKSLVIFLASTFVAGAIMCGGPEAGGKPPKNVPPVPPDPSATQKKESKIEYVLANCICKKCPSWVPACDEKGEKGGYCAVGKSACITKESGCICAECPVTKAMQLRWGYYCTKGSAQELMNQEEGKKKEGKQPAPGTGSGG